MIVQRSIVKRIFRALLTCALRSSTSLRRAHDASLTALDQSDIAIAETQDELARLEQQTRDIEKGISDALTKLAELLAVPVGDLNIPRAALDAYVNAANIINIERAGCDLPWWLLAGVGKVESNHGRGNYTANGTVDPPILGIVLDGSASLAIRDTDGGVYDGDTVYDRAVGPMQFIPGTWNGSGRDGNGDGFADPQNMYDAALASAGYLCRGARVGGVSQNEEAQRAALWSYNPKDTYGDRVLGFATLYAQAGLPAGFTVSPLATPAP